VFWFASVLFNPIPATILIGLSAYMIYRVWGSRGALLLLVSVVTSTILGFLLKYMTDVARPTHNFLISETSPSFPSLHTAVSTTYFLILLHFLRKDPNQWRRILHAFFCILCSVFVGVSRLYFGVHWFSDVVAGYILAGCVVFLYIRLWKYLFPSV
jgi:undecaprenyl-diphosphatase